MNTFKIESIYPKLELDNGRVLAKVEFSYDYKGRHMRDHFERTFEHPIDLHEVRQLAREYVREERLIKPELHADLAGPCAGMGD
jgi:hypothetical protein